MLTKLDKNSKGKNEKTRMLITGAGRILCRKKVNVKNWWDCGEEMYIKKLLRS